MPRVLAIDVGERRMGLAITDPSATLARPLSTVHVKDSLDAVRRVANEIDGLAAEEDGLGLIVVGLPVRLDGARTERTAKVEQFVAALGRETSIPIVTADERLSSREAESRLAARERDWRVRKQRLDAAAAAIILQDFLDSRQGPKSP
jgi:putative holliday junction resolvase